MKQRSDTLKPVLSVAERAETNAAQQYAQQQENHQQAQAKCDELKGYYAEYSQRVQAHIGESISPAQFQDNRAFLSRLNDIIRMQNTVVQQQAQRLESAKQEWLARRQQSHSLSKLAGQYLELERRSAERAEQHASDELSSVRHNWLLRQQARK